MRSLFTRLIRSLFTALIVCASAHAAFTISSASVGSDGRTFTVVMNGTYASGATTGCFSFSGGESNQFNAAAASVTATVGSATVTVVAGAPGYRPDTLVVSLAANPACAMTGSAGNAASGSVTAVNGSDYYAAGDSHWSGLIRNQGNPLIATDGNGYQKSVLFNSATGSMDFSVSSSAGTIALWTIQATNAITLVQDGVIMSRVALAGPTTYIETAFTGLDTGAHTFSLRQSSTNTSFGVAVIAALRCPSCVFTTEPPANPILTACGASYVDLTGGSAATVNADQTNWGLLVGALGITTQGWSLAGNPLYTALETNCPGKMVLSGGGTPLIGWLEPDGNDVGVTSQANYTAAVAGVLTNIAGNGHPPTTLFLAGIYNGGYGGGGGTCVGLSSTQCSGLYNGWMYTGYQNAAVPGAVFIHTEALPNGGPDWMNVTQNGSCAATPGAGSGDMMPNNHPCPATRIGQWGYGNIVNRQIPVFQAVLLGYSFSASATTGYGCSTVTLTIPGGNSVVGTPYWMDTLTATSSNASDTLTFTGSAGSTHSASLAVSSGANPVRLNICGPAGTRTISWSNLADGWVSPNPSGLTININPPTQLMIGALSGRSTNGY